MTRTLLTICCAGFVGFIVQATTVRAAEGVGDMVPGVAFGVGAQGVCAWGATAEECTQSQQSLELAGWRPVTTMRFGYVPQLHRDGYYINMR